MLKPLFWELKALLCKAPSKHFLIQTTPRFATTFTALTLLEIWLG